MMSIALLKSFWRFLSKSSKRIKIFQELLDPSHMSFTKFRMT